MAASSTVVSSFQRFELKYVVDSRTADAVRRYALPYLEPDPHAAREPDGVYRIASLYLDSPDRRLLGETLAGVRTRFKLRVRTYDADPDGSVFLEIKHRLNRVIRKVRCRISRHELDAFLDAGVPAGSAEGGKQARAMEDFRGRMIALQAQPQVVVGYRREAWQGAFDPGTRVTFDRDIRANAPPATTRSSEALVLAQERWRTVASDRVVLELKFNGRAPRWTLDLVRSLGLKRVSYSKYAKAIEAVAADHPRFRAHTA